MGAVTEEYSRFMEWLRERKTNDDVKRLAKIVHVNLAAVVPTVSAGGQRGATVTRLVRRSLEDTTEQIDGGQNGANLAPLSWRRLRKLTVGPFRGFRRNEEFDLQKDVVLIHGPNGSGKTSLCEAFEFALLGEVEEAAAKRIDPRETYFDNIHEGRHIPPQLWSEGGAHGIPVTADPELLRFAIVERNRIEGFARLAARSPAQSGALIATLFGLDAFNDFVANFTVNLDAHLKLATPQNTALMLKRAQLETAKRKLEKETEAQTAFDAEQQSIATDYAQDCTYGQLEQLLGLGGQLGRLQEITAALDEQLPASSGLTVLSLVELRRALKKGLREFRSSERDLAARQAEVSYRDLYRAVYGLRDHSGNACPACETPLAAVTTNPFERAARGLDLLRDLGRIEQEKARLMLECTRSSDALRQAVTVSQHHGALGSDGLLPLMEWIHGPGDVRFWKEGLVTKAVWGLWLRRVRELNARDARIDVRRAARHDLTQERERLNQARTRIDELRGRRNEHARQIQEGRESILNFDTANAELIMAAEQEQRAVAFETRIQTAYAEFYDLVRRYRDGMPERLLADLNEITRDLYNQFNGEDREEDKLESLSLPLQPGDRIRIAFRGAPRAFHDALRVLSEGHLRCLGLAILLAKNIKLDVPVLILDDAVNAIDHDHRAGIRATIFGEPRLREKQIILTSHSNEFLKDIQNQLREGATKFYVLGHHQGDHQPIVQGGTDRHYLVNARERLANGDQRQCLTHCRQSLENLTSRLWRKLASTDRDLGRMALVLPSPAGRPELRNLTEELEKRLARALEDGKVQGKAWTDRLGGLRGILRIPERQMAWQYFNKGTHDEEDREDFEVAVVRQIVESLTLISATLES